MFEKEFESIVGFPPAEHQRICAQLLSKGKSLILRAPTGSGKSESVWVPFLLYRGASLPMRMIHALPMRALANQLEGRMSQCVSRAGMGNQKMRVAAMHGQRPESVLFYADAIFATLDQVVTSYACAPLSLNVRHGNIPAGAIPGSLLVCDEVHTFEPDLGLQAVLLLAERACRMNIPFVIMSATLPRNFIARIAKRFNAETVETVEDQIPSRANRSVTLRTCRKELTAQEILRSAQNAVKTMVVVNTVDRALELYEQTRMEFECPIILAHSRFYDGDRKLKERQIEDLFGKLAIPARALIIATQVVEVGLDISCDLLLTELAPIDSLIQRAGRCARWGGGGEVVVYSVLRTVRPYDAGLVTATEQSFEEFEVEGQRLTWDLETKLVDRVLDPHFEKWASPEASGEALVSLAEAAFTGDPSKAERAVRDSLNVEVSLHESPEELRLDTLRLPRCRLHPGIFQKFIRERQPTVWRVQVGPTAGDDYRPTLSLSKMPSSASPQLSAGGHYVVHPGFACYEAEHGLRLGIPGNSAIPLPTTKSKDRLGGDLRTELWQAHIRLVVASFEAFVLPKERMALDALARLLSKTKDEMLAVAKLVLIFHDIGKLTREWQKRIQSGLKPGSLLAHRGGNLVGKLPAHATVSAWLATPCLRRVAGSEWEETVARPALAAIAHHHSVRADNTPEFKMADGWLDVVADCTKTLAGVEVTEMDFQTKSPHGSGSCGVSLNFLLPEAYTAYVLLSRWLRLSDRIATGGGEHVILRYEEWMHAG